MNQVCGLKHPRCLIGGTIRAQILPMASHHSSMDHSTYRKSSKINPKVDPSGSMWLNQQTLANLTFPGDSHLKTILKPVAPRWFPAIDSPWDIIRLGSPTPSSCPSVFADPAWWHPGRRRKEQAWDGGYFHRLLGNKKRNISIKCIGDISRLAKKGGMQLLKCIMDILIAYQKRWILYLWTWNGYFTTNMTCIYIYICMVIHPTMGMLMMKIHGPMDV